MPCCIFLHHQECSRAMKLNTSSYFIILHRFLITSDVISTWSCPILLVAWSSLAAHAYLPKHKRIWLTLKKVTIVWHAKSLHVQYVTDHQNLLVKSSQYPFYGCSLRPSFRGLSHSVAPQVYYVCQVTSLEEGLTPGELTDGPDLAPSGTISDIKWDRMYSASAPKHVSACFCSYVMSWRPE